MKSQTFFNLVAVALLSTGVSRAEIKVLAERIPAESAATGFKFKNVPAPARGDAAAKAKFKIVDGARDNDGGDFTKLHDGRTFQPPFTPEARN